MRLTNRNGLVKKLNEARQLEVKRTPHIIAATDIGNKPINQDSLRYDKEIGACVLADGIGGKKQGGEFYSDLATYIMLKGLREIHGYIVKHDVSQEVIPKILRKTIKFTNDSISGIVSQYGEEEEKEGRGTTLLTLFRYKNMIHMGQVGDGTIDIINFDDVFVNVTGQKAYIPSIERITKNHNTYEMDVKGLSDIEKQILGSHGSLKSYIGDGDGTIIDIYSKELLENQAVVMGTDGVSKTVSPNEILEIVTWNGLDDIGSELLDRIRNPIKMAEVCKSLNKNGYKGVDINRLAGDNASFIIYGDVPNGNA